MGVGATSRHRSRTPSQSTEFSGAPAWGSRGLQRWWEWTEGEEKRAPPPPKVACSLVAELPLTPSSAVRVEPSHLRGDIGGPGGRGEGWVLGLSSFGSGGQFGELGRGGGWQFQLHSPGSLCAFPWSLEGT